MNNSLKTDYKSKIAKLSPSQQQVLSACAVGQDGGHNPRTLEALVRKGLLERKTQKDQMFKIYRYDVPLTVHMVWCEWCAENGEDEATV